MELVTANGPLRLPSDRFAMRSFGNPQFKFAGDFVFGVDANDNIIIIE